MFKKPCFQTFLNFFQTFSIFDPKTGFFKTQKQSFLTQKLKLYVVFFEIFKIDLQFQVISELFLKLKF